VKVETEDGYVDHARRELMEAGAIDVAQPSIASLAESAR
jgi:hypothetical protein